MRDAPNLPAARRALIEKYLRGDVPRAGVALRAQPDHADGDDSESRERAVVIQAGGSRPPFFFLHGQWELGGVFCYRMAHALGSDQPFYALEPYRFDRATAPPRFDAVASAHLRSLRAVAPRGPYVLGGWCNGGLLAYEMACQLHAQGERVEQLILMDPVYLRYPVRLRSTRAAISLLGRSIGVAEERQLALYLSLRQFYRQLGHTCSYIRSGDYRRTTSYTGLGREDYPGIYDWTAMNYSPVVPYPGKITLLWSVTQPFRGGWRGIEASNQTDVHVLSCRHTTCLNEHLDGLIERLHTCLAADDSAADPVQTIA
jgi:hypothetical protein